MNRSVIADPRRTRRRSFRRALVIGAIAGAMLIPIPVRASHAPLSHVKGTFPNHGFLWLDDINNRAGWDNKLFVYSDRCKPFEANTWNTLNSQLPAGSSDFRGAWPRGITFVGAACTGSVDNYTDIMLDYMTATQWSAAGHGSYGGHHHYTLGDANWCEAMGAAFRCGYHISRIHINEPRVDGYAAAYRVQFLIHETGHSMGFYDYCGHTSVANNGMSCVLRGQWYSVDRRTLRDVVYQNSPIYFFS